MDTVGEGWGMNWERGTDVYTLPSADRQLVRTCTHRELGSVLRDDLEG